MKKNLDGQDSEAIRDMQRSRGWALFSERVEVMRRRNVEQLLQPMTMEVTQDVRGYVRALDDIRTIPDTIVSEIKSKGGAK